MYYVVIVNVQNKDLQHLINRSIGNNRYRVNSNVSPARKVSIQPLYRALVITGIALLVYVL